MSIKKRCRIKMLVLFEELPFGFGRYTSDSTFFWLPDCVTFPLQGMAMRGKSALSDNQKKALSNMSNCGF
jgi:hypothetical protein